MTKKEINEKMYKVQEARFGLAMKDRWSSRDYRRDDEYKKELTELVNELQAIGETAPSWKDLLSFNWNGEL